jgi:hypothetical protein
MKVPTASIDRMKIGSPAWIELRTPQRRKRLMRLT